MKKWITAVCVLLFLAVFLSGGKGMEKAQETAGELLDEEHPRIALTFDDGPHSIYTEKLLDGLKAVSYTHLRTVCLWKGTGRHRILCKETEPACAGSCRFHGRGSRNCLRMWN